MSLVYGGLLTFQPLKSEIRGPQSKLATTTWGWRTLPKQRQESLNSSQPSTQREFWDSSGLYRQTEFQGEEKVNKTNKQAEYKSSYIGPLWVRLGDPAPSEQRQKKKKSDGK